MTWYNDSEPSDGQSWFGGEPEATPSPVFQPVGGNQPSSPQKNPKKTALIVAGAVALSALLILGVAGAVALNGGSDGTRSSRAESKRGRSEDRDDKADGRDDDSDGDRGDGKVVLTGPESSGPVREDDNPSSQRPDRDRQSDSSGTTSGALSMDAFARKMCEDVIVPGYEEAAERMEAEWDRQLEDSDLDNLTSAELQMLERGLAALFEEVEALYGDVARFNDRYRIQDQRGDELHEALAEYLELADWGFQLLKEEIAEGDPETLVELASEIGSSSSSSASPSSHTEGFDDSAVAAELGRALHGVDPACTL